jgi:hypothetical protein
LTSRTFIIPNWLYSFPVPCSHRWNCQTSCPMFRCRAVIARGGAPDRVRYCFRDLLGAGCCKVDGQWPVPGSKLISEHRGGGGRPASDGFCRRVAGQSVPGVSRANLQSTWAAGGRRHARTQPAAARCPAAGRNRETSWSPDSPGTMLWAGAAANFSARKIQNITKLDKVNIPKSAFGRSM